MRDHPGARPAQHHRAEMMIGMMVRQDQPPDRLACDRVDDAHQPFPLRGARERIDHHDAVAGYNEAGVGASLRAPPCVTDNRVDAGSHLADGETYGDWGEDLKRQERSQMKRTSTDCWNTPPLLSFHTNWSSASRSARKENSTNGSRLMPEDHTKCATSWSPYVTRTSLMKWAGIGFPSGSRNNPVAIGCSTSARTSITSPRRMPAGMRILAAPSSRVISAAPVDGDAYVGRGAPQRAVRRFDDRPDGRRHPHLDPRAHEGLADPGREPELGEVDIGIVVHQQVDRLHVAIGGHRQVGLDHHRHDAPVGRHRGRVQLDVAVLNLPVTEQLLQDLLHLPRNVVRRPGPYQRAEATRGEREERETGRVEERAAREPRHTITTIGSPQPPGKFAYCDGVSHFATHAIRLRATPLRDAFLCNGFRRRLLPRTA